MDYTSVKNHLKVIKVPNIYSFFKHRNVYSVVWILLITVILNFKSLCGWKMILRKTINIQVHRDYFAPTVLANIWGRPGQVCSLITEETVILGIIFSAILRVLTTGEFSWNMA